MGGVSMIVFTGHHGHKHCLADWAATPSIIVAPPFAIAKDGPPGIKFTESLPAHHRATLRRKG
jgi:hypothetical protein